MTDRRGFHPEVPGEKPEKQNKTAGIILRACVLSLLLLALNPAPAQAAESRLHIIRKDESAFLDNCMGKGGVLSISDAPFVAASQKGYIHGSYPGITSVSSIAGGIAEKSSVVVKGILPHDPCLRTGEKQLLTLFNGKDVSHIRWTSSDPHIASISRRGLLQAKNPGTARISCRLRNGSIYYTSVDVYGGNKLKQKVNHEDPRNKEAEDKGQLILSCEETTYLMKPGDSYRPKIRIRRVGGRGSIPDLTWESNEPTVARVDSRGRIKAVRDGMATITGKAEDQSIEFSVNVLSGGESGRSCQLTLLTGRPSSKRTYTLFKQNAHNYDSFDKYLAWHGCAHCSLATVLGAYQEAYEGIRPNEVISGIEKKYTPADDWSREHEVHTIRYQMPLSLHGISTLLTKGKVYNEYVPSFSYKEARAEILSHLKTGNPVIIEVRKKSAKTGKSSRRWTNSYHTMVFLGAFTNGKVLLCDSIDRTWYDGGQRYKTVSIDDVMEYMFSSTRTTTSMYYDGAASDGGYIKVYSAKP